MTKDNPKLIAVGDNCLDAYLTKGFVTVTGNRLDICDLMGNADTLAEVTPEALALFAKRFGKANIDAITNVK